MPDNDSNCPIKTKNDVTMPETQLRLQACSHEYML